MKTIYLIISIGDSKKHYLPLIHEAYKKGYENVVVIKLLRNRDLQVQLKNISKSIRPGSVVIGHSLLTPPRWCPSGIFVVRMDKENRHRLQSYDKGNERK